MSLAGFEIDVHELRATNWSSAKALLSTFHGDWIFRGQASAAWPLSTAIERLQNELEIPIERAEQHMLKAFQRRAHHYSEAFPLPDTTLDWLSLMQHYGAPTRLLDFTRSSYVAAYFALETVARDGEAAVWAVNLEWCRASARECLLKVDKDARELPIRCDFSDKQVFDNCVMFGTCQFVVPVVPFRLHRRMTAQQGEFLCPGQLEVSFMKNFQSLMAQNENKRAIQQIRLSGGMAATAMKELNLMNINRATLFPGIEGLARSLQYALPEPNDWDRVLGKPSEAVAKLGPLSDTGIQW